MDVTVIIPTRNRSAWLSTTLRSALRQERVAIEVIVVDEASSDETPAVLAAVGDPRVKVLRHETPRGLSSARNHGAEQARGEWLAFLDDDDLWAPTKLWRQLTVATETGREWAYTGSVDLRDGRIVQSVPPPSEEEVVSTVARYPVLPGGGSNVIVRRETFAKVGPFETRLPSGGEDWELWIRLAKHGWPAGVRDLLMAKRLHASNMFAETARIIEATKIIEALHGTPIDWGRMHRWFAWRYLRQGQQLKAVTEFAKAAALGQFFALTADLLFDIRCRVRRPFHMPQDEPQIHPDPLATMAVAWLREFEDIIE